MLNNELSGGSELNGARQGKINTLSDPWVVTLMFTSNVIAIQGFMDIYLVAVTL